jgi:hypothetical protein
MEERKGKRKLCPYTVRLELEQVQFLRSQKGKTGQLIRRLIADEMEARRRVNELPADKIIRLGGEIEAAEQEIATLENKKADLENRWINRDILKAPAADVSLKVVDAYAEKITRLREKTHLLKQELDAVNI